MVYYRRLSLLALLVFVCLLFVQLKWLQQAFRLHTEQQAHQLQQVVPQVALAINKDHHEYFHGENLNLEGLVLGDLEQLVDSTLREHGIQENLYFAVFQEAKNGIFLSNGPSFAAGLLESPARACLSCIHSITFVPSLEEQPGESKEALFDRLLQEDPVRQFFTPIEKLETRPEETLWLSLYQANRWERALQALAWLVFASGGLILVLLGLFYHLLQSFSNQKQLSTSKEDFFNSMTHEFKTPLSSIQLAARVLQQTKDQEKQRHYAELIDRETQLLVAQVDRILHLALWDQESLQLTITTVDLQKSILATIERLALLIERRAARVSLQGSESPVLVQGDEILLANCMANLIENSLKYGPHGVEIRLSTKMEKGAAMVQITDTGPGIPAEIRPFIFDRYFRGHRAANQSKQGFGIGLSYVQAILKAHGATIALLPTTQGTTFLIKFDYASNLTPGRRP